MRWWRSFDCILGSVQHHARGRYHSGSGACSCQVRIYSLKAHFSVESTHNELTHGNCAALSKKGANSKVGVDPLHLGSVHRSIRIASNGSERDALRDKWKTDGLTLLFCAGDPSATNRTQVRSEEHTSELQSRLHLVCRLLL